MAKELLDRDYFEAIRKAQAEGAPLFMYRKSILARLCVKVIDSFSGMPTEIILSGEPGKVDAEEITISLWTDFEVEYFKKANKKLLELGYLQAVTPEAKEAFLVNQITDEEIREALNKQYFAVKALLDRFTSPVPVKRMLDLAIEMDKTIGVIDKIKERLSELQGDK